MFPLSSGAKRKKTPFQLCKENKWKQNKKTKIEENRKELLNSDLKRAIENAYSIDQAVQKDNPLRHVLISSGASKEEKKGSIKDFFQASEKTEKKGKTEWKEKTGIDPKLYFLPKIDKIYNEKPIEIPKTKNQKVVLKQTRNRDATISFESLKQKYQPYCQKIIHEPEIDQHPPPIFDEKKVWEKVAEDGYLQFGTSQPFYELQDNEYWLFGVTEWGATVSFKLLNFEPFFFVTADETIDERKVQDILNYQSNWPDKWNGKVMGNPVTRVVLSKRLKMIYDGRQLKPYWEIHFRNKKAFQHYRLQFALKKIVIKSFIPEQIFHENQDGQQMFLNQFDFGYFIWLRIDLKDCKLVPYENIEKFRKKVMERYKQNKAESSLFFFKVDEKEASEYDDFKATKNEEDEEEEEEDEDEMEDDEDMMSSGSFEEDSKKKEKKKKFNFFKYPLTTTTFVGQVGANKIQICVDQEGKKIDWSLPSIEILFDIETLAMKAVKTVEAQPGKKLKLDFDHKDYLSSRLPCCLKNPNDFKCNDESLQPLCIHQETVLYQNKNGEFYELGDELKKINMEKALSIYQHRYDEENLPFHDLSLDEPKLSDIGPNPRKPKDAAFLIVTDFSILGDKDPFLTVIHCLGQPSIDPIHDFQQKNVIMYTFERNHEKKMLEHWSFFRSKFDCEWLSGYNSNNYDIPYIVERANALQSECILQNLSRFYGLPSDRKGENWGGKERFKKCFARPKRTFGKKDEGSLAPMILPGLTQFDYLKVIKQLKNNLDSYKLKNVLKELKIPIEFRKKDMPYEWLAPYWYWGGEYLRRAVVYCWEDVNCTRALRISYFLTGHAIEVAKATFTGVDAQMTRGQQIRTMNLIVNYVHWKGWIIDEECRLFNQQSFGLPMGEKGEKWMKTYVKQEIKKQDRKNYKKLEGEDEFDENDMDAEQTAKKFKYAGATVLDAKSNFYETPVATLDFASLYPSIMISHQLCPSTIVEVRYDRQNNQRYYPSYASQDMYVEWDIAKQNSSPPNPLNKDLLMVVEDTRYGKSTCFIQNRGAVVPDILKGLVALRKSVRKQMEGIELAAEIINMVAPYGEIALLVTEYCEMGYPPATYEDIKEIWPKGVKAKKKQEEFKTKVLDARQAAIKVTCNACYGFFGAMKGLMGLVSIASTTCVIGRLKIEFTKNICEQTFKGDVVYGDTGQLSVFCFCLEKIVFSFFFFL